MEHEKLKQILVSGTSAVGKSTLLDRLNIKLNGEGTDVELVDTDKVREDLRAAARRRRDLGEEIDSTILDMNYDLPLFEGKKNQIRQANIFRRDALDRLNKDAREQNLRGSVVAGVNILPGYVKQGTFANTDLIEYLLWQPNSAKHLEWFLYRTFDRGNLNNEADYDSTMARFGRMMRFQEYLLYQARKLGIPIVGDVHELTERIATDLQK